MVLVNGTKYACANCINGHRSSSCGHVQRPLYEIKKKGRPVSQCERCRELRKAKKIHVRCACEDKPTVEPPMVKAPGRKTAPRRIPTTPALPNGLKDITDDAGRIGGTNIKHGVGTLLNPSWPHESDHRMYDQAHESSHYSSDSARSSPSSDSAPASPRYSEGDDHFNREFQHSYTGYQKSTSPSIHYGTTKAVIEQFASSLPPPPKSTMYGPRSGLSFHIEPMSTNVYPPHAFVHEEAARAAGWINITPLRCCNGRCSCPYECRCSSNCTGCSDQAQHLPPINSISNGMMESKPTRLPSYSSCCDE
ncbi:hypothetical protein FRC02_005667 [Tulasnella sp. 418]|nr:hypothetical protein FRC02_005667 [Tulasnella sp. 418]